MTGKAENVLKELAIIQNEASKYGDNVVTRAHFVDNMIVIDLISVPVMLRRQGIGHHILSEYQDVSDGFNIPLSLDADCCFGTPPVALHNFYTSIGFCTTEGTKYMYNPE